MPDQIPPYIKAYCWIETLFSSFVVIMGLMYIHYLLVPIGVMVVSYLTKKDLDTCYRFSLSSLIWLGFFILACGFTVTTVICYFILIIMIQYTTFKYFKGDTIWDVKQKN